MTTSASATQPQYVDLPIDRIRESPTNPRRRFADLEELAASIKTHGLLQPVTVRRVGNHHELIFGARRLRAAKLAGLTSIAAELKVLDDRTVREVQLIENLQRQDVHPLEESDGYKALMGNDASITIDEVAAKVGKSRAYVYQRLSLAKLAPKVRELVATDVLPLSYALKLVTLDHELQVESLDAACFRPLGGEDKYSREWLEPMGRLNEWLQKRGRLDPRSEHTAVLLPELAAHVTEAEQQHGAAVLAVSTLQFHTDRRDPKPILARSWKPADGKHKCQYARPGVIVLGEGQGRFLQVCVEKKKCAKHWPRTDPAPAATVSPEEQRRRAEQEARRQRAEHQRQIYNEHVRPALVQALAETTRNRVIKGQVFAEVLNQLRSGSHDQLFAELVGDPTKLPPARYAQAFVVANRVAMQRDELARSNDLPPCAAARWHVVPLRNSPGQGRGRQRSPSRPWLTDAQRPPHDARAAPREVKAPDTRATNAEDTMSDTTRQLADQQFQQLVHELEAGRSERLIRYLELNARFHAYSFHNVLLIACQCPTATRVAGYQRWKQLGRQVRRGEHGIAILAPIIRRTRQPEATVQSDEAEAQPLRPVTGFRTVYVFDVSQTDGPALPTIDTTAEGDPGEHLPALERAIRDAGIDVRWVDDLGGALGLSYGGRIDALRSLPAPDAFTVLAHEWAHEMLHKGDERPRSRTVRETEAEAVSYIVGRAIGVSASVRSSDYIALYEGDADRLRTSLARIQITAARILDALGLGDSRDRDATAA